MSQLIADFRGYLARHTPGQIVIRALLVVLVLALMVIGGMGSDI